MADCEAAFGTEVQRRFPHMVVAKWAKSLVLCSRLALVLYHEEARRKQQTDPVEARHKLPAGRISVDQHAGQWKPAAGPGRSSRCPR